VIARRVILDFLRIGGEFVPKLHGMTKFNPMWIAALADIAAMKAHAFQSRGKEKDYRDLLFTLLQMRRVGQTFARYRFKEEDIATIQSVVAGNEEAELCLSLVIR
jgi:hypothetical protein